MAHRRFATAMSISIRVTEPKRQGEGMSAYVTYVVQCRVRGLCAPSLQTDLPRFAPGAHSVVRRFKDFEWLYEELQAVSHVLVPPMPEKQFRGSMEPGFIELRQHLLERFLNRVASHPQLIVRGALRAVGGGVRSGQTSC
jgi:sorting nexin-1/2